jgi:hypothetical protein
MNNLNAEGYVRKIIFKYVPLNEITEIIKWYEQIEETSKLILEGPIREGLAQVCETQWEKANEDVPLLPLISSYSVSEFITVKDNLSERLRPDIISWNMRIQPMMHFTEEEKEIEVRWMEEVTDTIQTLNIKLKLESYTTEKFVINVKVNHVNNNIYDKTFVLSEVDFIDIEYYIISELISVNKTFIENDDEDELFNLKKYKLDELYKVSSGVSIRNSNIILNMKAYAEPSITSENIIISEYESTSIPIDMMDVKIIKGEPELVINVSAPTYKFDEVLEKNKLDDYLYKKHNESKANMYLYQAAGYRLSAQILLEELKDNATFSLPMLLSTTAESLGRLEDRINRAILYEPFTISIPKLSWNFKELDRPYWFVKNDDYVTDVPTKNNGSGIGSYYQNKTDLIPIKIRERMNYKFNPIDSVNLLMVYDNSEYVIYLQFRIINTPNTNSEIRGSGYGMSTNSDQMSEIREGVPVSYYYQLDIGNLIKVSLPIYESVCTVEIEHIYVCDKKAVAALSIDSGTIEFDVMFGNNFLNGSSTGAISGELVTREYGRLYCTDFPINRSFDVTNNDIVTLVIDEEHGSGGEQYGIILNGEKKEIVIDKSTIDFGQIIWTIERNSDDPAFSKDLRLEYQPSIYKLKEHIVKLDPLEGTGVQPEGTTYMKLTGKKYDTSARYSCVLCRINSVTVQGNRPLPPVTIGMRSAADAYQLGQENLNLLLFSEIDEIKQRLDTVEKAVDEVFRQIEMILDSMNPSFLDQIFGAIVDMIVDAAIPVAAGAVVGAMSMMLNKLGNKRRAFKGIFGRARHADGVMISNRKKNLPENGIMSSENFNQTIATALNKQTEYKQKLKKERPGYTWDDYTLQGFDPSEGLDLMMDYFTSGVKDKKKEKFKERSPVINPETDPSGLPTFSIHTTPLVLLPKPINKGIHRLFTSRNDKYKEDLVYNSLNVSTRKPSHAFLVYRRFEIEPDKSVLMHETLAGISELTKYSSHKNPKDKTQIGGITIKKRSTSEVNENGIRIYKPLTHEEHGYTDIDVSNYFKSLFRLDDTSLTTKQKWDKICVGVDKRILSTDVVYNTYLPDHPRGKVLEYIVNNPFNWQYNLWGQNCQNFVKDLMNYMRDGIFPERWPNKILNSMEQVRAKAIADALNFATYLISYISN